MAKEKEEPKQEISNLRYEVVEIATQTAPAIRDNKLNKTVDIYEILAEISNDIKEIKTKLG